MNMYVEDKGSDIDGPRRQQHSSKEGEVNKYEYQEERANDVMT
jgi:hypothetical protein